MAGAELVFESGGEIMSLLEDSICRTITRLHRAPEMVPPKPWMPRVFLYSDEIVSAQFAGPSFSPDNDVIVVQGAARGWVIDAECGIMLSDRDDAAGIETVGLAKQTADGWTAELILESDDWHMAVLVAPGTSLFAGAFPGWEAVTKIKALPSLLAWGFSPSGNTLVLQAPGMVWSYARLRD
jgi:hypothetical protein